MSSYLEKQSSAFKGTLASAASKLSNPKQQPTTTTTTSKLAPPSPSPSAPSEANTPSAKRKRDAAPEVPYSQPGLTSYGGELATNMTFAVDYLKQKREQKSLRDIISHLSLRIPDETKRALSVMLRKHPRVSWKPDPSLPDNEQTWQTGMYSHCPIIQNVNDATSLLGYLQRKTDASGVSVKDLKDGWPDCEPTLAAMEKDHKILVVRTKKDNTARFVWADDPSLHYSVESDFINMWHRVPLPSVDDMHGKLLSVGQKPTSADPRKIAEQAAKPKQQKKRAGKRIGKATNTHMQHLLQDYSNMRR
ncbi:TFIIE beta subunit core domain-containing protein [Sarocladium implicatum]|jgi:transcription initiation factor TFIIE subunit beta|nr:TFIIE beta subunit core domain-containing protein [Sarocladium implicatum]